MNDISFLKGYLKGFELLNSFTNDGKTYSLEILTKENNNIQDTLSKYYNSKNWIYKTISIENEWESILRSEIEPYFSQIISNVYATFNKKDLMTDDLYYKPDAGKRVKQVLSYFQDNTEMILSEFTDQLKSIVKDAKMIKIEVDWSEGFYECYANDYIFDLDSYYLYLHFGGSD